MKLSLRVWILIIALLLAILAIAPWSSLKKGVLVEGVESGSPALEAGIKSGMIILGVDGKKIENIQDYSKVISEKSRLNGSQKTIFETSEGEFIVFSNESIGVTVSSLPKSNIKTGLDLSGGSRAIIKAKDRELTSSDVNDLVQILENRFNAFGIADVTISPVSDLDGANFVLVEIAGATPQDLKNLISQQGKFEAKIGNETVFIGGEKDIASVCRNDATCAGIESCSQASDGTHFCNFRFSIYLSEAAAKRHAEITSELTVNATPQGNYLSEKLDLYLDDNLVDSLLISEGLKGRETTQISISGSGQGGDRQEAITNSEDEMHNLQTILITGSLPYQLEVVKLDSLSPSLGREFTRNIVVLGLLVFVIISVLLFVKYRKMKITLAVILTMLSEATLTLGIAALISWNLDAPSIAGIIVGMGTGVNDQIVIIDESVSNKRITLKERIKRALFIIFGAFFTIVAAMLPLFWVGAGMLKGFALTTIISVTVGILITRPAFADIIKKIEE